MKKEQIIEKREREDMSVQQKYELSKEWGKIKVDVAV